jgi:diaminohydroxyphosphoribosylaminopyrimidine deaminase/5-amino-6-(5-phosphoribosylamino)uracil reductase
MNRCLELARKGLGYTAPNPLVGCVIIHQDRIIGEGYHMCFGGHHAEVNAIRSVQDPSILKDSTLYVNLEPCSHFGKTPPCTGKITDAGIQNVVVGVNDPNSVVSGEGIRQLLEKGRNVITGVLKDDCVHLNKRFFTYHLKKRPYIILKWARTRDGFIDKIRDDHDKAGINWITDEASRVLVHKWRAEEQAIMVGSGTAIMDNPRLNTRYWPGKSPLRLMIDRRNSLPGHLHILDGSVETVVFTNVMKQDRNNLTYAVLDEHADVISALLEYLYKRDIQSLLVEGGKLLIDEFLKRGIWDEARVLIGNKEFIKGVPAPSMAAEPDSQFEFSNSTIKIYRHPDSF